MVIGIDFDNTIACYDRLFHSVATELNLIPTETPATKESVRDYLRASGHEKIWTELQGYVYAERISGADAFPGVLSFFQRCRCLGFDAFIVSHKTRHPFEGPKYDLHAAAYSWLERVGFFDCGGIALARENVYFEPSKQSKLDRLAELDCDAFVDDLPEFLNEPGFPSRVVKILFDPWRRHVGIAGVTICSSWEEIGERILGNAVISA